MTKEERIDSVVELIINNFEKNQTTDSIIHRLCTMYNHDNIFAVGNHIECRNKNMHRKIIASKDPKRITCIDIGEKQEYNKTKRFINKNIYQETDNTAIERQINKENTVIRSDDGVLEADSKIDVYKYYQDNRIVGLSFTYDAKTSRYDEQGIRISIKKQKIKKTKYRLANGDVLKIITENGKTKYYYCDNFELYDSDIQHNQNNLERICVEISENQANYILNSNTDTYSVLNNPIVYRIRKTEYGKKY